MQSCDVFTHNTQNSLLLLIHMQVHCDLVITRNTCVNVYSLNCLDLFLKYKIDQTCFVCVCVFWIYECFAFFLLRDIFESLKCCLDLWLISLLDCIYLYVFFISLKNYFRQAQQFLDRQLSIETLGLLFSIDLNAFLIHRSFLEFVSIASRQILDPSRKVLLGQQLFDPLRYFCRRQILDSTSTDLSVEN